MKSNVKFNLPKSNNHVLRKRKKKMTRKSDFFIKMLAVMEASQSPAGSSNSVGGNAPSTPDSCKNEKEFLSSGRTGRRNALPDILGQHSLVTSSDLSSKLQALTTNDQNENQNQPGSSKSER